MQVIKVKPEYEEVFPVRSGKYFQLIDKSNELYYALDCSGKREVFMLEAMNVYNWNFAAWQAYCDPIV